MGAGELVEAVGAVERGLVLVGVERERVRVAVEGDEELCAGAEGEVVGRVECEDCGCSRAGSVGVGWVEELMR